MNTLILICLFSFLPSCSFWSKPSKVTSESSSSFLINLVESTHIIRKLIEKNNIGDLLEDHDPEQLALLLDNTSPAQMAFESEVLSSTAPIVITYYFHKNKESEEFIKQLKELAIKYDDQIKFVLVDAEQLFSLAQDAQIERLPTILFVKDREIIDRFEGNLSKNHLEEKLKTYIK